MASTSNTNYCTTTTAAADVYHDKASYGSDPASTNTTFVQADPLNFRTIVQRLTGAPDDPSIQKLPLTNSTRPATTPGPKRPAFKLQERRQSGKNLQINLNNNKNCSTGSSTMNNSSTFESHDFFHLRQRGNHLLVSPVSTLDFFGGRVSPRSPREGFLGLGSPRDQEEGRAIAEKGFYLHPPPPPHHLHIPSPLSTPRGREPPELLPLFPLRSPREDGDR